MKIGKKTIEACADIIGGLLSGHRHKLNEAYLKAEDALTITINVKIQPGKRSGNDIKAKIKFISEQVQDEGSANVDEDQMSLFTDKVIRFPLNIPRPIRVGNPPRFRALGG